MSDLVQLFREADRASVERTLPWVFLALSMGAPAATVPPEAKAIVDELTRRAGIAPSTSPDASATLLARYAETSPPDAVLLTCVLSELHSAMPDPQSLRRRTDALLGLSRRSS